MRKGTAELSDLRFALLLTLPMIVFMAAVVLYPLGYSLWLSFCDVTFLGGLRAVFSGVGNYMEVLTSPDFWHSLWVSLRFTVESVVLTLAMGLGIALVLAKPMKYSSVMRSVVILPWAVSQYAAGIMFSYTLRGRTGIVTALSFLLGGNRTIDLLSGPAVIEVLAISNAWNTAPLVAFFLLANLEVIPKRLYDLAGIDRLGSLEKFTYVTLPYLRQTLYIFAAITTVFSLKLFDLVFVQTGGGPGTASATLTYQIYKECFRNLNLGYGAAMSVCLLIVILAATFILYLLIGRREA